MLFFICKLGEAEREILTLAPHFEDKSLPESFNSKLERLNIAAMQDITWLHLLSMFFKYHLFNFFVNSDN